jgi:hypothetical protein
METFENIDSRYRGCPKCRDAIITSWEFDIRRKSYFMTCPKCGEFEADYNFIRSLRWAGPPRQPKCETSLNLDKLK